MVGSWLFFQRGDVCFIIQNDNVTAPFGNGIEIKYRHVVLTGNHDDKDFSDTEHIHFLKVIKSKGYFVNFEERICSM